MNQHYLDNIFTMNAAEDSVLANNAFMDSAINRDNFLDYSGRLLQPAGAPGSAVLMKDQSRLWKYCNGGTPGP
jgi:hypothetical protein